MRSRSPQPARPPAPLAVVEVAYPEKGRAVHREVRPCRLPGCVITWVPKARPLCDMHWLLLPWDIRGHWEMVYRHLTKEAGRGRLRQYLANMLCHLMGTFEQDSIAMPPDHSGAYDAVWKCDCTACERSRERSKAIAIEEYPFADPPTSITPAAGKPLRDPQPTARQSPDHRDTSTQSGATSTPGGQSVAEAEAPARE